MIILNFISFYLAAVLPLIKNAVSSRLFTRLSSIAIILISFLIMDMFSEFFAVNSIFQIFQIPTSSAAVINNYTVINLLFYFKTLVLFYPKGWLFIPLAVLLIYSYLRQINSMLVNSIKNSINYLFEFIFSLFVLVALILYQIIFQLIFPLLILLLFLYLFLFIYKTLAFNLIEELGLFSLILFQTLVAFMFIVNRVEYEKVNRWGYYLGYCTEYGLPNYGKPGCCGVWNLHKFDTRYSRVYIDWIRYEKTSYVSLSNYSHHDEIYFYLKINSYWYSKHLDWIKSGVQLIILGLISLFIFVALVNVYFLIFKIVLELLTVELSGIMYFTSVYTMVVIPSRLETIKFKSENDLEIPGILFHGQECSLDLINNFNKCLSSSPDYKAISFVVNFIENELKQARSLMRHGFIYTTDLTNAKAFPVISSLVEIILNQTVDNTTGNELTILERLNNSNVKVQSEVFKQAYHLLCLNYWSINRVILDHIKEERFIERFSEFKDSDAYVQVQYLNSLLTKLLPNSVKRHLHNKSICLTNNIYAGFDTEFKNIDKNINKLLSVQVSVNGCYTLKIPTLANQHIFGSLDVSTNKFYESKPNCKIINYDLVNSLIQDAIDFNLNSNINYKNYITNLTESLIAKGVKHYIKEDSYHFKFPSSHIISKFIEVKGGFTMVNLFETIIELDELSEGKSSLFSSIKSLLNDNTDSADSTDSAEGVETSISNFDYVTLNTDSVYDTVYDSNSNSTNNDLMLEKGETTTQKGRIRKGLKFNRFSVYTSNVIYLTAHYNAADLSMLSDFDNYKSYLNVVNKSFVVINRPIPFKQMDADGGVVKNWNLKLSDTILLSPPGFTTLKNLGTIYNFNKLELSKAEITNMDLLLLNDRAKFKEYAVRDSIITLLHYNAMIDYNFNLAASAPPSTLSQISGRAVDKYWNSINYEGYQMSPMYSLANANKVYTVKGLFETEKIGDKLPLFIQTFRGGRNESFCYGMDFSGKVWYDYDLTSAYTTIMYGLLNPIYNGGSIVNEDKFWEEVNKDKAWLLNSYFAIKCSFKFPKSVNYPCLPCNYDSDNTVYPLKGEGVYTGSEILTALNLNCDIKIKEIFRIPKGAIKIFGLIKELHIERGKHKKGTFNNLMCKIIGNSAYGLTAQGINEIMRYDTVSNRTVRMKDSRFSNPIIAANISSFIRALLAEIMNNISKINGKIVSVTTDGFITDIPDLENLLLDKINKGEWKGELLIMYRKWRSEITNGAKPEALEIKQSGPNRMSWTTRGQLSTESGIAALTGLQRNSFNDLNHIACVVKDLFNSEDKTLEFMSMRLRTASDIFKKGGHVTSIFADKSWSIIFDNKRKIIVGGGITDYRTKLFFTEPHATVEDACGFRNFNQVIKTGDYEVGETKLTLGRYKNEIDLTIKAFIKALTHNQFGLTSEGLTADNIKNIVVEFKEEYSISTKDIYNIKSRRPLIINSVPKTLEGVEFINHVKKLFPNFNENPFWK